MINKLTVSLLLFYLAILPMQAAANDYIVEKIAKLADVPWGLVFINSHQIIVTLRAGQVAMLDLEQQNTVDIIGVPEITAGNQGGLLDVATGPNYHDQGWIYFTYSKPTNKGDVTTLSRAKIKGNHLVNWQDLLITDSASDTGRHFGSRITFDEEGHVYFGVGDRGVRENSQKLSNHAGSIIRLTLDGKLPLDNPFVNQAGKRAEIWSYGHRNPQGLVYDRKNKLLWSIEHGPRGGDEINLIKKGLNYGWPVVSHGREYALPLAVGEGTEKPGMESPRKVYIPSIAPGSLLLYDGEAFPEWQGNLFAGALKLRHLNRVEVDSDHQISFEHRLLEDLNERIRALTQSPEGWIYFSTDSGKIMRIRPNS